MPKVETLENYRGVITNSSIYSNYVSKIIGITEINHRNRTKRNIIDSPKRRVVKKLIRIEPIYNHTLSTISERNYFHPSDYKSLNFNNKYVDRNEEYVGQPSNIPRNFHRKRVIVKKKRKNNLNSTDEYSAQTSNKRRRVIVTKKRIILPSTSIDSAENTISNEDIKPTRRVRVKKIKHTIRRPVDEENEITSTETSTEEVTTTENEDVTEGLEEDNTLNYNSTEEIRFSTKIYSEDDDYEEEDTTKEVAHRNLPDYEPFFPELSESLDAPILLLKTTILSSVDILTKTVVQSKLRTYTFVVTRVSGDEQIVTSTTEVKPHTKTIVVTEPITKYTTLTLLDLDATETLPFIPMTVNPSVESSKQPETQENKSRALDEARYNLATRIMSNGVEVIVAGDKSTLPGEPDIKRILPSTIYKPVTLKPSTLTNNMMMALPQDIESLSSSLYPNQFVTKTCLTTFTYMTTYLENGTTAVSSHEQVVSNIATEERNTGKILPTPTMGITLTQYPNLAVGTFMTTYTYLNTILDGEQPLVVTSKRIVTNTVTAPDDYLSLFHPGVKDLAIKDTNTYYSTIALEKTLYEGKITKVISTNEVVTQVVITESIPPRGTSVMTSYIALDFDEKDPPIKEYSTTDVVKTYFVTYTYYNTQVDGGNTAVYTNISTSSDVVTEKLFLHSKKTKGSTKSVINTAPIVKDKENKKKNKLELDYSNFNIFATKTYLTTFTYYTTLLQEQNNSTATIISSHSRVVENVQTETIEASLLDKKYLNSIKKEIRESGSSITKLATLNNGQKIEITAVAKEKIKPTKVLPIEKTRMPEVTKSVPSIESSNPNVVTGSTIIFVDEFDDPFAITTSHTPLLSTIIKTQSKNALNSLLSSEIVKDPQQPIASKKKNHSKRNKATVSPSKAVSTQPGTKTPEKFVKPNSPVSNLLGSINIQALKPVLNAMAGLIQTNLKSNRRNDSFTTTPKAPEENEPDVQNRSPIYIPVGGLTDIETAESQNIAQIWEEEPHYLEKIPVGIPKHESPLLQGGISISPGEIITTNSDVIVGKPGRIGPRIPAIPLQYTDLATVHPQEIPLGMKPPPVPNKTWPKRHSEQYSSHPIIHAPNKDDYVGPPPPAKIPIRPQNAVRGEKHTHQYQLNDHRRIPINSFHPEQDQIYSNYIKRPNEDINYIIPENLPHEIPFMSAAPSFGLHSSINEHVILPEVIERSTGQPLLINLQPSQVALVNIPHNRTTALIYGGSTEPHINGQYFDDPSPYPEPEFSAIESYSNGIPKFASIYNDQPNRKQVGGVIKVANYPININPPSVLVDVHNSEIKPSKPSNLNLVNGIVVNSYINQHDINIQVPPISFGMVKQGDDFNAHIINHENDHRYSESHIKNGPPYPFDNTNYNIKNQEIHENTHISAQTLFNLHKGEIFDDNLRYQGSLQQNEHQAESFNNFNNANPTRISINSDFKDSPYQFINSVNNHRISKPTKGGNDEKYNINPDLRPPPESKRPNVDYQKPLQEQQRPPLPTHLKTMHDHQNQAINQFDHKRPNLDKQRPAIDRLRPPIEHLRPHHENQRPLLKHQRPQSEHQRPEQSDHLRPQSNIQRPQVEYQRPEGDHQKPQVDHQRPHVNIQTQRPNLDHHNRPQSDYKTPYADLQRPQSDQQRPEVDHQRPQGDHQRPFVNLQRPQGDQPWIHSEHRRPSNDQQRPYVDHKRPQTEHQRPPLDQQGLPADHLSVPVDHQRPHQILSVDHKRPQIEQQMLPLEQQGLPADHLRVPIDRQRPYQGLPLDHTRNPTEHHTSPVEYSRPYYGRPNISKRPRPTTEHNYKDILGIMSPPPLYSGQNISPVNRYPPNGFNMHIPISFESYEAVNISNNPLNDQSIDDFDDDLINEAGEVIQESNSRPLIPGEIPIEILRANLTTTTSTTTSTTTTPRSVPSKSSYNYIPHENEVLSYIPHIKQPRPFINPVVRPENHQTNQINHKETNIIIQSGSPNIYANVFDYSSNTPMYVPTTTERTFYSRISESPTYYTTTQQIPGNKIRNRLTNRPKVTSLPLDTRRITTKKPIETNYIGSQTEEPFNVYTKPSSELFNFGSQDIPKVPNTKKPKFTTKPQLQLNKGEVQIGNSRFNTTKPPMDMEIMKPPPVGTIDLTVRVPEANLKPPIKEISTESIHTTRTVPHKSPPVQVSSEEVYGMTPPRPNPTIANSKPNKPIYSMEIDIPEYKYTTKSTTQAVTVSSIRTRRPSTRRSTRRPTTTITTTVPSTISRKPIYWQRPVTPITYHEVYRNRTTTPKPIEYTTQRGTKPDYITTEHVSSEVTEKSSSIADNLNLSTERSVEVTTRRKDTLVDQIQVQSENNKTTIETTTSVGNVEIQTENITETYKNQTKPDLSILNMDSEEDEVETFSKNVEILGSETYDDHYKATEMMRDTPILPTGTVETVELELPTKIVPTRINYYTHRYEGTPHHVGNEVKVFDDGTTTHRRRVVTSVFKRPIHKDSKVVLPTRYITHTKTSTVTITKTTVVKSLGAPPSTMTILITKTEKLTIVDTVTEFHTLVKPTTIAETVIVNHASTLYPAGGTYGTYPINPTQVYASEIEPTIVVEGDGEEELEDFIINDTDVIEEEVSEEIPQDNESFFVVMTDENQGSIIKIPKPTEDSRETQHRDEMLNSNEANRVLLGGILIASPPSLETSLVSDRCHPECKASRNELCQKFDGVMRCVCRPGFARMFPDRPCKPTYTYTLRIALDKHGKENLHYEDALSDTSTPEFAKLASATHDGLDRMVMQSDLRDIYHGVHVQGYEPVNESDGVVNTFNLQLSDNIDEIRLKEVFQKYLRNNNYSLGGTELYASKEILGRLEADDFDECIDARYHDCSEYSHCFNLRGTYTCSCKEGYADLSENILYPGRICSSELVGCEKCHYHGTCYSRDDDQVLCECFQWYAGESCQINLKVLLIALVTLGVIMFTLLLICIIITCARRKPDTHTAHGMSFLPQRVPVNRRGGTLDRRAMIQDTSSESGQSDNNTIPYVPKKTKKLKGALKKPKPSNLDLEHGPSTVTYSEQKDRSLTVMIPRAKYHPAPPISPHNMTNFDKRKNSAASSNEAKLLSYLDAGPCPNKVDQRKYSKTSENYRDVPGSRKTSGALISAGFEVSATVGVNNMGTLGTIATTCGTEADRSENATLIQKISADLLSSAGTHSQFNTLRKSITDADDDALANWLDITPRIQTISESRSYDETTIQPPMKSFRNEYDSKSSQHPHDEANTMAERDLGSTFLLPHTHLYKPDRGSDISGFESL